MPTSRWLSPFVNPLEISFDQCYPVIFVRTSGYLDLFSKNAKCKTKENRCVHLYPYVNISLNLKVKQLNPYSNYRFYTFFLHDNDINSPPQPPDLKKHHGLKKRRQLPPVRNLAEPWSVIEMLGEQWRSWSVGQLDKLLSEKKAVLSVLSKRIQQLIQQKYDKTVNHHMA